MNLLHLIKSSIWLALFSCPTISLAQISVHQEELQYYNASGHTDAADYESAVSIGPNYVKSGCNLEKVVYGWHPYWVGSAYQNYQWDKLSHLSFFSYEVDAATGNAISTHGWSTSAAVTAALGNNKKVTLCVTLFSGHSTFFGSSTAQQTLITNLINLVSARGAHGVNIDFEGLPSSQATNFANFMVNLANQFHAAIPNSEVSTVLYAVDWNNVFNFSIMEPAVDQYIIMGYDYYYSGSSTAGPNDPLYHFGTTYNYTLSKSVSFYLNKGCPKDKLILGLPHYGREWSTSSSSVPSSTLATGVSRTYKYVRDNTSGNYSSGNFNTDNESASDYYLFLSGTTNKQCFINREASYEDRMKFIRQSGIGGMGIWALGYDDGYNDLWNLIGNYMSDCYASPCSDIVYDFGGPLKNYYNNENYTWTIAPDGASSVSISFASFALENNYDFLYIYDGPTTASPQIPGSPFTGVSIPPNFTSSTGALTFRFTSDGSTVNQGFSMSYTCVVDQQNPTTEIVDQFNWITQDTVVNFTDLDNGTVVDKFWLVKDFNGTNWSANPSYGMAYDDFSTSTAWTSNLGNWSLANDALFQVDETQSNTDYDLPVNSNGELLIHWQGKIGGSGTNRRAGLHWMCSNNSTANRGDSYMVYWRVDSDKCQIYKSVNDVLTLMTDDPVVVDVNTTYDFKVIYDPATGEIRAYMNDLLSSAWTDPNPIVSGSYLSLRTGNCTYEVDDLAVYSSRLSSENLLIGSTGHARYQSVNPTSLAAVVYSVNRDNVDLFSSVDSLGLKIDWTVPEYTAINDGLGADVSQFNNASVISGNWSINDMHSGIQQFEVGVGDNASSPNIVGWTSAGLANQYTFTGLSLTFGQTYYWFVRPQNAAGLDTMYVSNGQVLVSNGLPSSGFFLGSNGSICAGDTLFLANTSQNASQFTWSTSNGQITTAPNGAWWMPQVSGPSQVQLIASNGSTADTLIQSLNVSVYQVPDANFVTNSNLLGLPNAVLILDNQSIGGTTYSWDFGDGASSTDVNPWHQYDQTGVFTVQLIASNGYCPNDTIVQTITVGYVGLAEATNRVELFPNPTSNWLTIQAGKPMLKVRLLDYSGKTVALLDGLNIDTLQLDLSDLANGMYLLEIDFVTEQAYYRIAKQ